MKPSVHTYRLLFLAALCFNVTLLSAQEVLHRPPKPNTSTSTTTKETDNQKAKEQAEREAAARAEQERKAKERAEQEAARTEKERKAKEQAEREAAARAEKERKAKEQAEREAAARAEQERKAKEQAEREAQAMRATGTINGHEYVDLGLSVKWARCNVGASSPSDYGNYYAWGEIRTKSEYTENNSVTYGRRKRSIAGNSQYDAARANWGGTWRLPTTSEIYELISKCTRVWTTMNGKSGYKVTGPNGNSIFLPAAGYGDGTSLYYAGSDGYYWSATPSEGDTGSAYYLDFGSGHFGWGWYGRGRGRSVRPVSK